MLSAAAAAPLTRSPRCSYTVQHWEPPNKVVVTGDSASVAAVDEIVFTGPEDGPTTIEYTAGACLAYSLRLAAAHAPFAADIKLKGILSLFTFLVAGDIRALGDEAKVGMNRAFAEGRHK